MTTQTFAAITKPLKQAAQKAGMKESDVPELVQRFHEKKRQRGILKLSNRNQ